MGRYQRDKGKRGELELAHALKEHLGCEARRGRQFSGSPDSPDVVTDIPGVHIESKRTEKLSLYAAMKQAKEDTKEGDVPVVCHRRNGEEWLVIVELPKLAQLCDAIVERFTQFTEEETS